jgi:riboflavin kinase/FMN adenylyltransferase
VRVLSGPWEEWDPLDTGSSITVGVLDGVHLGHRRLISQLDPGLAPTVLTFEPHPVEVLSPGTAPRLLTTIEERVEILGSLGVVQVGVLDLAPIKALAPDEFVERILLKKMNMEHLVIGGDFRFGKDRAGDVDLLDRLSASHDFSLEVVELVRDREGQVSSTRIRELLEAGRPEEAAALLGAWYRVTNSVVEGDRRGAGLGYPTINLRPPPRKLVPATGVYACFAHLGEDSHQAAVNVGVRPTFGGGELLLEAHLLDFDRMAYGELATLEFVRYLRPELAFGRIEELVDQIGEDVAQTRLALSTASPNVS